MDESERLLKLKIRESKGLLKELLALTKAINNNRKASELYQLFKKILQEDLGINKYAFYRLVDQHWVRVFSNGLSEKEKEISVEEDLIPYSELKALTHDEKESLKGFDFLIPVQHKEKALAYVLLKESSDENHISPIIRNLNFIQTLANIIVVAIENKRLFKEQLKKESEIREMELAAKIQRNLLPYPMPVQKEFEAEAFMQAHHDIGGDYYDLVKSRTGDHIMLIADISGKGTSAALVMSNLQALFRATCLYENQLDRILRILNASLNLLKLEGKFVTLFIGKYLSAENKLEYINAGHPEQFLLSSDKITSLHSTCSPLGVRAELNSTVQEVLVNPNDILFCYTDGLMDVYNEKNEWLAEEGVKNILLNADRSSNLMELQEYVLEQSILFSKRINRDDDVALLSLRFT